MKRPNLCCLITLMVSMPFMFPRQLFIITPSRVVPPSSFVSFQSFFQFNFSFSFLLFLLYKYLFWLFISFLFFLSKLHLLHLPRFKSFSLCFSPVFSSLVFCIHHVFFFSIKRMANDSQPQVVASALEPIVDGICHMTLDLEVIELSQSQVILPSSLGSAMHAFLGPLLTPQEAQNI